MKRNHPVMMTLITMPECGAANNKSDENHAAFKIDIVEKVDAKQRQCTNQ